MITWVIDNIMEDRSYETGMPLLAAALASQGYSVIKGRYIPIAREIELLEDLPSGFLEGPIVVHGSIQFCREFRKKFPMACPGVYQNDNVKSFVNFATPLRDFLLNKDYIILPYGAVKQRSSDLLDQYGGAFFIKPLSGMKEFTGKVLARDNITLDITTLNTYEKIDDNLLCVIAPTEHIKAEFRYVICDNKVVTGSEYRWGNVLDIRVDTLPECDALAKTIAEYPWQADYVYVCDIAMTNDGPKVIELNSFSSSGLYACDTNEIARAVSAMAQREFEGDI